MSSATATKLRTCAIKSLDGFGKIVGADQRSDLAAIAAETALKAMKLIEEKKIRDWTANRDVENAMMIALEDLLYLVKGRYEIAIKPADMDEILGGVIRVAKRRDMPQ